MCLFENELNPQKIRVDLWSQEAAHARLALRPLPTCYWTGISKHPKSIWFYAIYLQVCLNLNIHATAATTTTTTIPLCFKKYVPLESLVFYCPSTFSHISPVLQSTTLASPTKFPGAGDSQIGCHHPGADNPMDAPGPENYQQTEVYYCYVEVMPQAQGFNDMQEMSTMFDWTCLKMPGNLVAAPDPRMQRNSSW